jgi:hypothetical protein
MYIDNPTERPVPASSSMRVTPDTILAVRDAIQRAVDEAERKLGVELARFRIAPCADDPVSRDAATAWNYRLVDGDESHAKRIHEYLEGLHRLVGKLSAVAQTYAEAEHGNAVTIGRAGA